MKMVRTRSGSRMKGEPNVDKKELLNNASGSDRPESNLAKKSRKRKVASENSASTTQVKKAKRSADVKDKTKRDKRSRIQRKNADLTHDHGIKKENVGDKESENGLACDEVCGKEDKTSVMANVKLEDGSVKKVGAHVSISGGLHNSVQNALDLGANAFGLFLRNQRQWAAKPLKDDEAEQFTQTYHKAGFSPNNILPHGIYLMNCASPDEETLSKSREALIDELKRCERLGLTLYNFHPGSTCGKIPVDEGIQRIAESINRAHKETKYVITLIENMCCQGHTIGGKFEELKSIIDRVDDKTRIGVCFDTCHAFAAGYDIRNTETLDHTMERFEEVIGLKYLKAVHLNDSKGECGCSLDRHENIGHGKIGSKGFKALMNDDRFNGIPMILETPECDYSKEIKKLYSFVSK